MLGLLYLYRLILATSGSHGPRQPSVGRCSERFRKIIALNVWSGLSLGLLDHLNFCSCYRKCTVVRVIY